MNKENKMKIETKRILEEINYLNDTEKYTEEFIIHRKLELYENLVEVLNLEDYIKTI